MTQGVGQIRGSLREAGLAPALPAEPSRGRTPERPGVVASRLEANAGWLLGGPLSAFLVAACILALVGWAPQYLTWPWWADLDQFAVSALQWDAGTRPYRDTPDFDFPAPIYVFWVIGKLFGWGRTAPYYAFDAGLVGLLGLALGLWSKRVFGRALPGLVSYLVFVGYYLGLDFTHVAQRDWHGPLFALLGVMILERFPGRRARVASALAMAAALAFRPQPVLFLPAILLAVVTGPVGEPLSRMARLRALAEWLVAFAAGLVLVYSPILLAGVGSDFLRALRVARYGGSYNRTTLWTLAQALGRELAGGRALVILAANLLLARRAAEPVRRVARVWSLALVGAILYKPISPVQHDYLDQPLFLVSTIALAPVLAWLLVASWASQRLRLAAIGVLLAVSIPRVPAFWSLTRSVQAAESLWRGQEPRLAPLGAEAGIGDVPDISHYTWRDYQAILTYIREHTERTTRVANLLRVLPFPSVNGPTGRLTPLPAAAGLIHLVMVDRSLEDEYVEALRDASDCVVVWVPHEDGVAQEFVLVRLTSTVRMNYVREARFGLIEIWRKRSDFASTKNGSRPEVSSANPHEAPTIE